MYSNKTAFYLSIVTIVICCSEAVLVWVISDTMVPESPICGFGYIELYVVDLYDVQQGDAQKDANICIF